MSDLMVPAASGTTPARPGRRIPLSLGQAGIWFNEQLGGVGTTYTMPFAVSFDGDLDVPALVAAVEAVVRRHPALGGAVVDEDGVPWLIPSAAPVPVAVRPVYGLPDDELAGLVRTELLRPFDLRHGPLARVTLYRLAPDRARLVVAVHHLVFDGQSTDVFVHDLAALYRGDALPALTPAEELVAAEAGRVHAALPAAAAYWAARGPEAGDVTLPGLSAPAPDIDAGDCVQFTLPPQVRAGLAAAAESLGVSRFELILASLLALLHRYGNAEPTVAVDLGTRTAAATGRIGLHVNELPVGSRPAPSTPFGRYARELRAQLRELYRFREVPLARAVPGRKPAVALAPITLTYRRRTPEPQFAGVRTAVDWVLFNHTSRGALRVHLVDGPDELGVILQFSPRAIGRDRVLRLAAHWLNLMNGALDAPQTPLGELPVLTPDERVQVLDAWNATAVDYPAATLLELFARNVAEKPDAPAVVFAGATMSYAELDATADRLAHRLRARGAGPGEVVAICLERSAELVVAMLGVLKAGAAYLPLDPTHPADRLGFILADAGACLLLTRQHLVGSLPRDAPPPILIDDAGGEDPAPLPRPAATDRAYVIYTSGSTGRPKGVEIGHAALANLLLAMRDELGAESGLVWLALTSPSFDISALELFLPLVVGGRVVVAPDRAVRDGEALRRLVAEHRVTHVQATPSGWRLLLAAGFDGPSLTALCGGEELSLPLARELRARVQRLWNVYGPTETTIWSTCWPVPATPETVSIGRPIANTRLYVLDEQRASVPVGVAGELYIGGAGLARGYLGRPDLTAERFVADPFGGGRMYRTGDRVRYHGDGSVEYLGRIDNQVKVRGYRIEPGEIEARLLEVPGVAQAAVAQRPDADGDGQLLACIVPQQGAAPAPAAIRAHLAAVLPEYMLPAAIVTLQRLPLTPNGKLDRAALPDLPRPAPGAGVWTEERSDEGRRRRETPGPARAERAPASTARASEASADIVNPLTREVADICREVLRLDAIGPDDSLFDLGAHSLKMTQIAARIRRRLKVDLSLHVFYDDPSVSRLVTAIGQARARS